MELLVLACVRSCSFVLISVGFAIVFGSCRVLNLMHGTYVMIGAYATYLFIKLLTSFAGYTPAVVSAAVLLSALATGLLGFLFFLLLQVTRRTTPNHILAISVAGNLFISQLIQYFWGTEGISVPPVVRGTAMLGSVALPANDLIVPPLTAIAVFCLWLWLYRSRSGLALRAVADAPSAARLAGVNADRVLTMAVGISAFMAGSAGALTAPSQTLSAQMWIHPLLVSFAVVVFGGRGSLLGAVVAAFVLGLAETFTAWFWSEAASQYAALLLIVAGLVVRPGGLAGLARYEAR